MGDYYLDWLLEVVGAALAPLGFDWDVVDEQWLYRARSSGGYNNPPLCVMWHHTAGADNAWGDARYQCYYSVAKPISNITIDSRVALILAGGATNTNGSGNSQRFSRGSVPDDSMNTYAFGMELCNNGIGGPYYKAMVDAAFAISNAVNKRCGNLPSDVCTHEHYAPDRKVDPATAAAVEGWNPTAINSSGSWSVVDLANECERRATQQIEEIDMPLTDDDIRRIWAYKLEGAGKEAQPASWWLTRAHGIVRRFLGAWSETVSDPTMLKEIHSNTKR